MGPGQYEAEAFGAFGAFGQPAQVAAAVEEVVDELPPRGFLFPYGEALGPFIPFGEGVDGLFHGGQDAVGRTRSAGPGGTGGGQVAEYETAQAVPVLRRLLAKDAARVEFVPGQTTPGGGDSGEDLGVAVQKLRRRVRLAHPALLHAGCSLDAFLTPPACRP
ncbi:hypothetical protein AB0D57_08845 [Streptomyces sp. NPDC048275]|uniref:hypothetical protein n=1 Tax=Streptomyces sp. NPDC048275 TaxID=3155629 RepID=UPI0033D1812C